MFGQGIKNAPCAKCRYGFCTMSDFWGGERMTHEMQTLAALNLSLILQLVGLIFAVNVDSYIEKRHKRLFAIIIVLVFSLIIQSQAESYFDANAMILPRTVASVYGYAVYPIVIIVFIQLFYQGKNILWLWVLAAINAALNSTAFFSGICFCIDSNNHFQRGPLGKFSAFFSFALLAICAWFALRQCRNARKSEAVIPLFFPVLIAGAVIADQHLGIDPYISFLGAAMVSGCIFYYIWLHLQFVYDHEETLREEQRIQTVISQIQPHFLYNTLSTIQALCRKDPEKAEETIEKFGTYLRQNLESSALIPFDKELEHTKIYADIEKLRFPNITINYDIADSDFELPALSVQPMVENAVRHGVRIKKEGIITVSTYAKDGHHIIVIEDNGKGFEKDTASGSSTHIGIKNVKERIEKLCGGTFEIVSEVNKGTKVTVKIPDERKNV